MCGDTSCLIADQSQSTVSYLLGIEMHNKGKNTNHATEKGKCEQRINDTSRNEDHIHVHQRGVNTWKRVVSMRKWASGGRDLYWRLLPLSVPLV